MAKQIIGTVSSNKGDKTIVVTVQTRKTHPLYRKQYTNLDELKAAVEAEWQRIPVTTLRNCMLSIPRRLGKVVKLKPLHWVLGAAASASTATPGQPVATAAAAFAVWWCFSAQEMTKVWLKGEKTPHFQKRFDKYAISYQYNVH